MFNIAALTAATAEPEIWFVCALGVGVVFVGLVVMVGIVQLMNLIFSKIGTKETPKATVQPKPAPVKDQVIENKQEILAAVCAAVAEEEGTDISAIRVLSFKKL